MDESKLDKRSAPDRKRETGNRDWDANANPEVKIPYLASDLWAEGKPTGFKVENDQTAIVMKSYSANNRLGFERVPLAKLREQLERLHGSAVHERDEAQKKVDAAEGALAQLPSQEKQEE